MDKVHEKWKSLGFLEQLTEEDSVELAHGFEYMAQTLVNDINIHSKKNRHFNENVDVISFPTLRRVFTTSTNLKLTEDFIDVFLENLNDFSNTESFKRWWEEPPTPEVDPQAELLLEFIRVYYGN